MSRQPKIGFLPGTINTALKLKFYHNQTNLAERERPQRGLISVFLLSSVSNACCPHPPFFHPDAITKLNPFKSHIGGAAHGKQNKTPPDSSKAFPHLHER